MKPTLLLTALLLAPLATLPTTTDRSSFTT
jgi:hypothetical protein